MADVRDFIFNLLGRETVSGAAKKAADGIDDLGDSMKATGRDADRLDREIEQAEAGLRDLAVQFARTQDAAERLDLSKSMRRQQTEIRRLTRSRDLLPDFGKAGEQAAGRFGVDFIGKLGPLMARMPMGPVGGAIGGVIAAAVVPPLVAAVGGVAVSAAVTGAIVGGVALAARDSRVQAAGKQLGAVVMGDLDESAARFVQPTIAGIGEIQDAWNDISGDVDATFKAAARHVQPLARGVGNLFRELAPGIREAVDAAGPIMRELGDGLPRIGRALGDLFRTFADNADEGASALRYVFMLVEGGINTVGTLVDWFGDLYRATLNVADASSLWAETLYGRIPIIGDRIKENRARILELKGALEDSGDAGATGGEKAAGGIRKVGEAAATATPPVKTLFETIDESVGRVVSAEEANIRMAAAFRNLRDAAKEGADKGIDPNTEAGERNRRALIDAAVAANANAKSIRDTTGDHKRAAEVTAQARTDFLKAADAMGVEKDEAIKLANKLFGIPKKVDTKAEFDSRAALAKLQTYNNWLSTVDRDVYNRVITETVTRRSARGGRQEFSHGGVVRGSGPRGVDSELILAAPGEGVLSLPEMDRLGGEQGFERLRAAIRGGGGRPAAVGSYAGNTSGATVVHKTYHLTVQVAPTASPADVGREVRKVLDEDARANGYEWRQQRG